MKTYRVTATGSVAADDAEVFESVHHVVPITRTLPARMLGQGGAGTFAVARVVHVCDAEGNAGLAPITVAPGTPGQLINGAASYVIQTAFQCATFRRTGNGGWSTADDRAPSDATFSAPGSSVVRAAPSRIFDDGVRAADFMTSAELADVSARTQLVDVSGSVQRAIDHAIYRGSASNGSFTRVILPPGDLRLDDTIHLGYGVGPFTSVILEGQGARVTRLWPTKTDRPGIAIQGGRQTNVRDLGIYGLNQQHVVLKAPLDAMTEADLDAAAWLDPALHENAGSRWAPYAGIAIDPYCGPSPPTPYPAVNYPAFLGSVPQYDKKFSSMIRVDNVEIQGFAVAILNQVGDATGNGDYLKVDRAHVRYCQYGISICNTQARISHVSNSVFISCHTVLVTTKHGRQTGKPSIMFTSTEMQLGIKWLDVPNTDYGGGPTFIGCYGEGVHSIGNVGSNSTNVNSVAFRHCEFVLDVGLGAPAYVYENHGIGFTEFDGCTFEPAANGAKLHFYGAGGARSFAFTNNNVELDEQADLYEKFAVNSTLGVTFNELGTDLSRYSCRANNSFNLDTGDHDWAALYTERNAGTRRKCLPAYTRVACAADGRDEGFPVMIPVDGVSKVDKSFTVNGRDVTFDTGMTVTEFMLRGGDVGDIMEDSVTGAVFYVKSRTGSTITMRAQTGYTKAGELRTALTASGTFRILNTRRYTPEYVTTGATTAGSAIMTAVQRGDGNTSFIEANVAVGDAFYVDPRGRLGNEIPAAGTAVSARSNSAGTITLSGNFARTEARVRLKLFVRAPAPNA